MVDDEDYDELIKYEWSTFKSKNTYYARRHIKGTRRDMRMHTMLLNTPKGLIGDHIDGNGLNNQRSNLRIVTHRQNCQNRHINKTSSFPGVYFNKNKRRWESQLRINGKRKRLGLFTSEQEAFQAYVNELQSIGETVIGY